MSVLARSCPSHRVRDFIPFQLFISIHPRDISFFVFLQSLRPPTEPPHLFFLLWWCAVGFLEFLTPIFKKTHFKIYIGLTLEWIASARQTMGPAPCLCAQARVSCSQSDPPIRQCIAFYIGLFVHTNNNKIKKGNFLLGRRRHRRPPTFIPKRVDKSSAPSTVLLQPIRHTTTTSTTTGVCVYWPPHFPDLLDFPIFYCVCTISNLLAFFCLLLWKISIELEKKTETGFSLSTNINFD